MPDRSSLLGVASTSATSWALKAGSCSAASLSAAVMSRKRRHAVLQLSNGRAVGQAEQHADAPGGGLGADVGARRVRLGDELQPVAPPVGVGPVLHEAERHRAAGADRELPHPRHLALDDGAVLLADHAVDLAVVVDGALEHALAEPAHDLADGQQLLGGGPGAGHLATVGRLVQVGAGRREAERPAVQGLLDQLAHRHDVLGRRRGAGRWRGHPWRRCAPSSARPCRRR